MTPRGLLGLTRSRRVDRTTPASGRIIMGAERFYADVSAIFEWERAVQQLFLQQYGVD